MEGNGGDSCYIQQLIGITLSQHGRKNIEDMGELFKNGWEKRWRAKMGSAG